jgi:hypothetical protein
MTTRRRPIEIQQMGYIIIGDKIDTRRLGRAPAQVAAGDYRQRSAAAGGDEDQAVDAGQHHPAA